MMMMMMMMMIIVITFFMFLCFYDLFNSILFYLASYILHGCLLHTVYV